MNEQIELVKKWLSDPKSVTQKELEANSVEAGAGAYNIAAAYVVDAADAAANATYAAYTAKANAVDYANPADYAAYCVKKYEELTS
jgi:hypothetical protein